MKKKLVLGSLVVVSVVQYASPAFANKEIIGNIIGGVIGGGIGTQIGKGNGNKAAIIIGAIAGTMIGGKLGRDMDEADRRACEEAQRRALRNRLGEREDWDGRRHGGRSGARGSVTTTREGYNNRTGEYCREYNSVIYLNNRSEETRGIACSRPDGSWYEVRETEVRFGGRGGNGGGYGPGRQEPSRPPRYPEVPSRPMPPPPPSSYQARYEGSARIVNVTRRSGGEWVRVTLRQPLTLEQIEVHALAAGVRIHEAVLYTDRNDRIQIRQLTQTGTIYSGGAVISERLNLNDRVQVIDLRAESMGGSADIIVKAISNEAYPSLSGSRY
ncbi:hypothetical protein AZI85_03510 [Bdellovibrio bacteriovorus]|uniref:Glycine zipper 2TM domain-containing protein n=1 Tax=Bdellovibrio bacteriovorus TaxID=959 RepID=A0A150WKN7_BDEBC|nr:beta-sandwich domain-containing protein [Bdellovibrio bacteriovorus]KYG64494.1 hypothetical protein AZI85_03510 [Bdellovibrio bacteriovorus]